MTIKFIDNELIIGSATIPENVTLRFSDILKIGVGGDTPSWQDIVLSGNGSLTLTNAKANGINYVKLFGACEQDGTPTPTVPVDIVCNNGALKVRHQSGLPLGYQPYEYLTASGNQWLNTGVKLASTDIVETVFQNSSTTGYGALYGVFAMGDSSAFYANGTYYGYDSANGKVDTGISVDTSWHTLRHDFGNGTITLDGNDTTYTPFEFTNTKDNYLFARYYNNSYGYGFKGSCKRYKVIRNGELICDLIPAIQLSDNAIGMYDLVNDVFRDNKGSGSFTIANPINDLELYVDGTTETVEVDTTGNSATAEPLLGIDTYKDVQEVKTGTITRNVKGKILDGTEDWTKPAGSDYFRLDGMFEDTIPYASDNPAIVCSHFVGRQPKTSAGNMNDKDIKLGYTSTYNRLYLKYDDMTTADDLKDWLADQYNAGTPVIVVYPLATATTETVTGQTLHIQAGTNIVEITQASIDNLPLEVSYKGTIEQQGE